MAVNHIKDEILQLTKDLIHIPSTSERPDKISQCADFIVKWLDENSIKYSRHDINNVPSITVLPSEKRSTKVLLMAHFDVVEVEDESLFTPRVENDRLYGRGAIDDKYAVALSLLLFRNHLALLEEKGLGQENMCFGLLLTGDEEIGGRNGVGTVGENIETDFFLALDGGNPGLIVTREKGILRIRLEATGKSAHAARPWLGRNAFDLLMEDYMAIRALFTEESVDHWHKTVALTKCTAGNGSANMIPGKAEAILDIRYPERDDPDELLAAIKKVVAGKVTLQDSAAVFFGGESPSIDRLQKHAMGAVLGFEHGSSDARYLSERNIPGALWGAAGEMSQHTEEEHIVLDSLYFIFDRLDEFLRDTAET